ncbi:thioesterase domain-containing protein, partial [Alkalimonas amylolytica]
RVLVDIWARLLAIAPESISTTANFFELGGHSILITRFISDVFIQLERNISVRDVFNNPHLGDLALLIESSVAPWVTENYIISSPKIKKNLKTIFMLPQVSGEWNDSRGFFDAVDGRFNLILLQQSNADMSHTDKVIDYFVEQILLLQPESPYLIGGYSLGGLWAFAVAQRLIQLGFEVSNLLLLDSSAPGLVKTLSDFEMSSIVHYQLNEAGLELPQELNLTFSGLKQELQSTGNLMSDEYISQVVRRVDFVERNIELAKNICIDEDILLPICLFKPVTHAGQESNVSAWKNYNSEMNKIDVAGDHNSMVSESNVVSLCDSIAKVIGVNGDGDPNKSNRELLSIEE